MNDNVKNPSHYKIDGLNIESIDIVNAITGQVKDGRKGFRLGNILKYLIRAEKKNGLEDYEKARQYLDWLIEEEKEKLRLKEIQEFELNEGSD